MRILGGEAKGRRMRVPGRRVRPTKGVVKKALFELLEQPRDVLGVVLEVGIHGDDDAA